MGQHVSHTKKDISIGVDSLFSCAFKFFTDGRNDCEHYKKSAIMAVNVKGLGNGVYIRYVLPDALNSQQGNIFLLYSQARNALMILEFYALNFYEGGIVADFRVKADQHTKYFFVYEKKYRSAYPDSI